MMDEEGTKMDAEDNIDDLELGDDLGEMADDGYSLSMHEDGSSDMPSALPLIQTSSFGMIGGDKMKLKNRTNAKTVECYDMEGNLVGEFPSGSAAAHTLGVAQGDISLCCRGLKDNVNGFKFRFKGDPLDFQRVKRGYQLVEESNNNVLKSELNIRTTRASRGEYVGAGTSKARQEDTLRYYLAPPELRARGWEFEEISVGHFTVKKWIPTVSELNQGLQDHKIKVVDDSKRRMGRRR